MFSIVCLALCVLRCCSQAVSRGEQLTYVVDQDLFLPSFHILQRYTPANSAGGIKIILSLEEGGGGGGRLINSVDNTA